MYPVIFQLFTMVLFGKCNVCLPDWIAYRQHFLTTVCFQPIHAVQNRLVPCSKRRVLHSNQESRLSRGIRCDGCRPGYFREGPELRAGVSRPSWSAHLWHWELFSLFRIPFHVVPLAFILFWVFALLLILILYFLWCGDPARTISHWPAHPGYRSAYIWAHSREQWCFHIILSFRLAAYFNSLFPVVRWLSVQK